MISRSWAQVDGRKFCVLRPCNNVLWLNVLPLVVIVRSQRQCILTQTTLLLRESPAIVICAVVLIYILAALSPSPTAPYLVNNTIAYYLKLVKSCAYFKLKLA